MRSLLNKAFTPRAIQSQRETVVEVIEKYLGAADPVNFDVVQDFSGPFPVEVITRMAGVPEEYRQQVRHWIDTGLHHEPGQIEVSEAGMQANIDTAMYYFGLIQERRAEPQDDMISRLIAAEIPGEDGQPRKLDDIEITGFATLLGGAGAETVTKLVGNAAVLFARHPDQWQKLQDDRDKIPAAVEELLRYAGPVQYNVRYTLKEAQRQRWRDPAGQTGVPVRRRGEPRPGGLHRRRTHSTSSATRPKRSTSASATGFTAASAPRWPAWKAGSRWKSCSTSCRATKWTGRGANACTCKTSRAGRTCPSRCFGKGSTMTKKIEVDWGLCESNGVCMGINPDIFELGDDDMLTVQQAEVTPENEADVREAVRQCPRQAISIVGD